MEGFERYGEGGGFNIYIYIYIYIYILRNKIVSEDINNVTELCWKAFKLKGMVKGGGEERKGG